MATIKQKSVMRSVQTLGAVALPVTLEEVHEETENKIENPKPEIFSTDDWKNVERAVNDIFRKQFFLTEYGILYKLHQSIKNILRSRTGTFLSDCYKDWVAKEMAIQARQLWNLKGSELLQRLEGIWVPFYTNTLPMLEAVFYVMKPKGRLSVRGTTLVVFRDVILFAENIEDAIRTGMEQLKPDFQQMILTLTSVNDTYPPSKNKLRLESLAAKICASFMGYFGFYENGELLIPSNEPARRRPSEVGPRRISRPFSVQPQQMETLNQLFKNAVKHKTLKGDGVRSRKIYE